MRRSKRDKLATILMCLFLGYLGIHRIYTGHLLIGFVYFCTGGFFGIGVIIDLLFLVFGSYEDIDGRIV
jgi:TM2 domain-containing membrane protein YozV